MLLIWQFHSYFRELMMCPASTCNWDEQHHDHGMFCYPNMQCRGVLAFISIVVHVPLLSAL